MSRINTQVFTELSSTWPFQVGEKRLQLLQAHLLSNREMSNKVVLTAILGLLASVTVGLGEYLLHYDAQARFAEGGYAFMQGIHHSRSTLGHFLGVFGATLYPFGCFHIYQMLRPANTQWAFIAFLVGSFGFIVGAVWVGSRASISALVQLSPTPEIAALINLYEFRYESLLQVIRLTTLAVSLIIVWLSLTGRSHYPKWMALFNPILLIILNFVLFIVAPSLGKHSMPIALNVAFFSFFAISLCIALRVRKLPTAEV